MTLYQKALDSDANRRGIGAYGAFRTVNPWTFAAATTGAVGVHNVFTITGEVSMSLCGVVRAVPAAGGQLDLGFTAASQYLATVADATALVVGEFINTFTKNNFAVGFTEQNALGTLGAPIYAGQELLISGRYGGGNNIVIDISGAAITSGRVDYYCLWRPLSDDGNVSATTPA